MRLNTPPITFLRVFLSLNRSEKTTIWNINEEKKPENNLLPLSQMLKADFYRDYKMFQKVPIAYSSSHCSIFPCWFWHDCSNVFLPCTLATKEQILKSQIRKCECLMPSSYHTGSMEHIFKIKKLFHSIFTYPLLCVQESQELDVEKFKWIFLEENQEDEQLIAKVSSVFFLTPGLIFYRNIIGCWN